MEQALKYQAVEVTAEKELLTDTLRSRKHRLRLRRRVTER